MPGPLPGQIFGKAVGACVEMIQPYARRAARLHFYTGTRARSLAFTRTARLMSSLGRRPEDNRDSRLETACFAHRYEDGDRDTGLKAKYVKAVESGSDRSRSRSRSRSPKRGRKLREGARVEARFRGKSSAKWFPGKVRRVHSDGTVDVSYEDGDTDSRLKEKYVRALDSGSDSDRKRSRSRSRSPKRSKKPREGDKVEADLCSCGVLLFSSRCSRRHRAPRPRHAIDAMPHAATT